MNNSDTQDDDLGMCLACIGAGALYDGDLDECNPCPYCENTGEATTEMNEIFLSSEVNYN